MADDNKKSVDEAKATDTEVQEQDQKSTEQPKDADAKAADKPAENKAEAKAEKADEKAEAPKAEEKAAKAEKTEAKADDKAEKAEQKEAKSEKDAAPKAEKAEAKAEKEEAPKAEKAETEPKAEKEAADKGDEKPAKKAKAEKTTPDVPETSAEPDTDFNWEEFEHGIESYSEDEVEKLDAIYEDTLTSIDEGEVIDGTVVAVSKKEVVVNIGYKSEGIVQASEFRYNPDLKPGDKVEIYVESQEDKDGQLVISHKTARIHKAWDRVNNALDKNEIINGYVKCRTKGGLIVDVFGLEAFLPGSQIDVKPIRDYDMYVGKTMEFKVVKINKEFKNVVVSHKALIEAELEEQKKEIISKLEKGQVLEGTVKNITSYGVFVDLGGVDGLVHITDLSWGRINHPEEVVELDQKINVVILDFDDDKKRIALGLKQLSDHPWEKIQEDLEVGKKVKGKVVVMADYGAFVEIAPGVEGLIHVSEMSWSQHLRSAQDFLKVGDEVEAVILTLDKEERKMSLGMKQLTPDPWADIEEKYPVDSRHKAIVRNFTNFGVFVELEEGVDGLIHISDLSWQKKVKHPSEFCNIGEEIEVVVLEVDKENRRLSLGHKQLEENPWEVFETVFSEGSVHEGTVTAIEGNQATINLPYGVEGICSKKHLRKEDGSDAKVDEKLDFMVVNFNKGGKKITVSHTHTFEDASEILKKQPKRKSSGKSGGASKKAVQDLNKNQEKTTLGDLGVLGNLKADMEKEEGADDKKKDEKEDK